MSANRHLFPGVDTTLLKTRFAVVTDAFGALKSPVKSKKFPLAVNLVRYFYYFLVSLRILFCNMLLFYFLGPDLSQ